MPKVSDMFPSTFLKAPDLKGKEHKLTMKCVSYEEVSKDEKKPVLFFKGKDKGLVLNKTNANLIGGKFGDDTDAWEGHEIIVYPTETTFEGKQVDCIRVRMVLEQAEDGDDDIPF